jgi:hypothetical protein
MHLHAERFPGIENFCEKGKARTVCHVPENLAAVVGP